MEIETSFSPRRAVSLPFTDYCKPLAELNVDITELIESISDLAARKGWKFIEFRGGRSQNGHPSRTVLNHVCDLSEGEDRVFERFRSSTRRNVKKAVKEGVVVSVERSLNAMRDYYRLHCYTRKRHGIPPQPFSFFSKIHKHIISNDLGFVLLARHRSSTIAGAIYFLFRDSATYKFGASDPRSSVLRANNLVMWEAIRWSARNGFKSFSFGRTESWNEGLRQFKNGWGCSEEHVNYYRFDFKRKDFVTDKGTVGEFQKSCFSKMPVPVLRTVGALLYRHVG